MILLDNITKSYGGLYAIKNLSLEISKGEFIVVFGPNGAGKSTLLKILSTVLKPTRGTIHLSDKVFNNKVNMRTQIGFVSHESYLYENLTGFENLVFFARLYGIKNPKDRAYYLLNKMQIENRADDLVKNYSQGMKQRLALCRGIINNPELVILDEPFNSLDIAGVTIISNLLKNLKTEGKTILMSSHNYEISIELSDRILVLVNGELRLNSASGLSKSELYEIYTQ